MAFICQIALSEDLFPDIQGQMAYIFMTSDDDDYVDGTWEPEGGENAVIIQPGKTQIPLGNLTSGPSLLRYVDKAGYERLQPEDVEYQVKLSMSDDPTFSREDERYEWDDEKFGEYAETLDGNKIAGTPIFLQGDEFPDNGPWKLLLQLDSTQVSFHVNFGDAGIAYAFINEQGTEGRFLWQCS